VLEVGSNYEYAVVGHPSRLYFWILSRTPTLDPDALTGILDRANSAHFETNRLEYTPQPPAGERNELSSPQGDVPAPPHAGCAVASSAAAFGAGTPPELWLLGVAGVATILHRRRARR
jgi:hypothetical protein